MKRITLMFFVILLAGCATEKGYREYLNTWIGSDLLTLVREWGAPEQVYSVQGHDFYGVVSKQYKLSVHLPRFTKN